MPGLRFLTAGESHGPLLLVIVDGLPAGMTVKRSAIDETLRQRQAGVGRGDRMKIENDAVQTITGLRGGKTLGGPIGVTLRNRDGSNWRAMLDPFDPSAFHAAPPVTIPRPGHADFAGAVRHDRTDLRDVIERASARETAARMVAGALALQFLSALEVDIEAWPDRIGGVDLAEGGEPDPRILKKIELARETGDTLGCRITVRVSGMPVGIGSYAQWDRRLDARLAFAVMSIQSVKGVGFGSIDLFDTEPGSVLRDEFFYENGALRRSANHAGGIEGGMSNGQPILLSVVQKPIPTQKIGQSVDLATRAMVPTRYERSDTCVAEALSVLLRGVVAFELSAALLNDVGGCTLADVRRNLKNLERRAEKYNLVT